MRSRWFAAAAGVVLALAMVLPMMVHAYGNQPGRGDWRGGGPHRTINALALEEFIGQARSDPILAQYTFDRDVLKVQGPAVGEPGMFKPGREIKNETFRWWVIEGGYMADEPELYASFRHFYNPRHQEMGTPAYLTDHLDELGFYFKALAAALAATGHPISAKMVHEIGKNPEVDARDWAINGTAHEGWGENEYSWTKGLHYLKQAFASTDAVKKSEYFARAWRALGETMHLLGDMTCPPHVRNDSHPAYAFDWSILPVELRNPNPNEGFLKADPYESFATENLIKAAARAGLSSEAKEYVQNSRDVLDLFDRVALFTSVSVFSGETVSGTDAQGRTVHSANGMPDFPAPKLDPKQYHPDTGVYSKRIGDREVCLAHESWLSEIGWAAAHPRITRQCVTSQAELLIPAAVAANARLIDWFLPRVQIEITAVDTDNRIVRGTFTHHIYGAHKEALKFNTAEGAFNRLYLNGTMIQDWDDYTINVRDGVLTVTYGDKVARNIESLRQGGGAATLAVTIDVGGIEVRSNEFPLTPTTPTPTTTTTLTPTPTGTPETSGRWVLQGIVDDLRPPVDDQCYFDKRVVISDGSFTSSYSWTDRGCVEGGSASGSTSTTCSWTAPPSYLPVGEKITLQATCQSTAEQTGGGRHAGGWMEMWYQVNPPPECLTCSMSWGVRILNDTMATGWTGDFPISGSQTGTFEVPDGRKDDVLAVVAGCAGPGGGANLAYKYVFAATEPPIERTPPPTLPPLQPPTPTPTDTPPPTVTPTPTETPIVQEPDIDWAPEDEDEIEQPLTATSTPGAKQFGEYGPVVFSSEYDYDTMQPVNPRTEFAHGITTLYADWAYRGTRVGTVYEYAWYRDGELVESSGNILGAASGHSFDFLVRDPAASQPLETGTYTYVVRINGQPVLSGVCTIR